MFNLRRRQKIILACYAIIIFNLCIFVPTKDGYAPIWSMNTIDFSCFLIELFAITLVAGVMFILPDYAIKILIISILFPILFYLFSFLKEHILSGEEVPEETAPPVEEAVPPVDEKTQ